MVSLERSTEYGSFARLLGENSMEELTRSLLEDRRCMDCEAELDDCEGTTEFRGQLPHVELIGHLCALCWERREEVGRYLCDYTISLSPAEEER